MKLGSCTNKDLLNISCLEISPILSLLLITLAGLKLQSDIQEFNLIIYQNALLDRMKI